MIPGLAGAVTEANASDALALAGLIVVAFVTYVIGPPVAAWARHKWGSDISRDAASAVKTATNSQELPIGADAALIQLSRKLQEMAEVEEIMERRDAAWAMHTLHLEVWGEKGWVRSPEPHDPMPARPRLLRPEEDD